MYLHKRCKTRYTSRSFTAPPRWSYRHRPTCSFDWQLATVRLLCGPFCCCLDMTLSLQCFARSRFMHVQTVDDYVRTWRFLSSTRWTRMRFLPSVRQTRGETWSRCTKIHAKETCVCSILGGRTCLARLTLSVLLNSELNKDHLLFWVCLKNR